MHRHAPSSAPRRNPQRGSPESFACGPHGAELQGRRRIRPQDCEAAELNCPSRQRQDAEAQTVSRTASVFLSLQYQQVFGNASAVAALQERSRHASRGRLRPRMNGAFPQRLCAFASRSSVWRHSLAAPSQSCVRQCRRSAFCCRCGRHTDMSSSTASRAVLDLTPRRRAPGARPIMSATILPEPMTPGNPAPGCVPAPAK